MAAYRIKDSLYRIASREDDGVLRQLLHDNAMPSWVSVTTEREPSYFEGASLMGESYTLIAQNAEDEKRVIGMYACSYLPVHIDGKAEIIGYFGGMRLESDYRYKLRYIKQGFEAIRKLVPFRATVPFYFTSIASENDTARRLLEANIKGMPCYRPAGEMTTLIFSVEQGRSEGVLIQATVQDIPDIVIFYNKVASAYQFSPHLSEEWLGNLNGDTGLDISDFWLLREPNDTIQGCFALWDQRTFKQSIVKGYKAPLDRLRTLYNLYARMSRRVELPATGEALEHIYIAFFACDVGCQETAVKVIKEAAWIARSKKATSCILGLSSYHPLLPMLKRSLKPSTYRTQIETVTLHGDDTGEKPHELCMVQPEVALL